MIAKPGARGAAPTKPQPKPAAQRVASVTRQMANRSGAKPMPGRNAGGGIANVPAKPPAPAASPAAGMPNGVPPRLQALAAKDPAAAQARYAQFQAGQLPGQQQPAPEMPTLQGPPMPMPRPVRQGMAQAGAAMGAQGPGGPMQRGGGIMPLGANLPPGVLQALQSGNFGGMPGQGFPGGPQAFQELPAHLQGFQGSPPQAQGMGGPGSDMGFQSGGGFMAPPMTRGRGGMQSAPGALDAYFAPQQVGRGFGY